MFAASKTASVSGGYQISRSLRFNSADSAYLNRTPASATNRKTWTWSGWLKRSNLGAFAYFFGASPDSFNNTFLLLSFGSSDNLRIQDYQTGFTCNVQTTAVYRDVSAWYHVVIAIDTTQATAANRVRLYVNGVEVTAFSTATYPTQNTDLTVDNNVAHVLGYTSSANDYNGYMTEVNFIDGQQLTPSSFGQTDAQTGVWTPKAYSGSYGTNGFYLNFSDNSNTTAATLGKDYSGNGNNWTPNNFSVTAGVGNDSLVDSPTAYGTDTGAGGTVRGNYATINPLQLISNVSVSNGNLYLQSNNNQDQFASAPSTIAVRTGKWYAEFTASAVAGTPTYVFGVGRASWSPIILDGGGYYGRWWYTTEGYAYLSSNGGFYNNNSTSSNGATYASGDIIGVAMDLDAGSIAFYKNGTLQGTPFTSIPLGVDYVFAGGAFTTPNPTPTNIAAFFANYGQRPFAYTAPSGYKALCTQNLPTPTIGATTATQAGKYFNPVLYTGTAVSNSVSGVGFQPDMVWIKRRDAADNNVVDDAVRGAGQALITNATVAEQNYTSAFTAFNSDGFTVTSSFSALNASAATYVAWNWKANGSGSTNTAGSITSTVSANTTSGFSIVTYTGNGTGGATVGHGLGVAPSMVICKTRTGSSIGAWQTYHSALGATKTVFLNLTDAAYTNILYWNNTAPTSSVFTIGANTDVNTITNTYVAYCFAEVSGYSKFGSYTGNGSTDGPFVYCGFRPAFIMRKNTTNSLSGDNWYIQDVRRSPYNVTATVLAANQSYDEATFGPTNYGIDVLSNGFKIRDNTTYTNSSGSVYIYAAFAENPFKYSLAR